jgi:NADH:ubiquinone oxidoreductase subunit F (NADH-binding)
MSLPTTTRPDRLSAAGPTATAGTWSIGAPRLLAGLNRRSVLDYRDHLAVHGQLPPVDRDRLLGLLDAAAIAGRGGAGFPLATKLRSLKGVRPTVVVNGSESEPASMKDRTMLRRSPHLVLDGALTVASAVRAGRVIVAVHDAAAADAVHAAIRERRDTRRVRVEETSGEFVTGEARTLLRVLGGGPVLPPGRKDLPTARGLLVSNVETFAQVAVLVRMGARDFASSGTHAEPGTTLLTLGGAVERPGVVEVPIGTPLGILLRAAQADHARYIVAGGYHGTWLLPRPELQVSRNGLKAVGATLGAGVLYVLDDATCALGELTRVSRWLAAQSAGQCGPCRFGLPSLAADVAAAARGDGSAPGRAEHHARLVVGRGACAHPDGASRFVRSGLATLGDELAAHRHGGCGRPVLGQLPVGGIR